MPYDYELTPEAEDDLINLWLDATDPGSVTQASHRAEQILKADPRKGKHQSEGLFRIYEPPLLVYYEIDEAKHL